MRRLSVKYPPRLQALNAAKTTYYIKAKNGNDVKRVSWTCAGCGKTGLKNAEKELDHVIPVADENGTSEDWNVVINGIFTPRANWQVLCIDPCHNNKTAKENAERAEKKKIDAIIK